MVEAEPYTLLARIYDGVMRHVDYSGWAEFVAGLIRAYAPSAENVLELGCGTGTLAGHLLQGLDLRYHGIDRSTEMIALARQKLDSGPKVVLETGDFTSFAVADEFDAALLLYDGLNYLLSESDVERLMRRVHGALAADGIFIVDQSTRANSIENADFFEDRGRVGSVSYVRQSRFDEIAGLHHTIFEIHAGAGVFCEHHIQRAYEVDEIARIAERTGFEIEASLDGMTNDPASARSVRVHWVLRRTG